MRWVSIVCALLISGSGEIVRAQDHLNTFVSVGYHQGTIVSPNNQFYRQANLQEKAFGENLGFQAEFGWQTTTLNTYNQLLNYPSFGLGLKYFNIRESDELGNPIALYAFFDVPFYRSDRLAFKYSGYLGFASHWNPEHPVLNPFNNVIGSYKNMFVSSGFSLEYTLTSQMSAGVQVFGVHFSNGRKTVPNQGVNVVSGAFSLRYYLQDQPYPWCREKTELKKFSPSNELYMTIGSGSRQESFRWLETRGRAPLIAVNYSIYNLSLGLQRQVHYLFKFGGGVDLIYYGPTNARIDEQEDGLWTKHPIPFGEKIQVGLFGSAEWVLNNFSVYAQPGYRIYSNEVRADIPDFYQHLAVKYHLDNFLFGIGIRAVRFSGAEYIEWNLGYRLVWDGN